jgi:hypothetical protein
MVSRRGGTLLGEPKPILIRADGCLDVNAPMKVITDDAAQPNTSLGTIRQENRDGVFKVSPGYDLLALATTCSLTKAPISGDTGALEDTEFVGEKGAISEASR